MVNPEVPIIRVSCRTGQGVEEWTRWLEMRLDGARTTLSTGS
jgi:Ni2+-binding GTPase involved in maturation of urease and hydrogenase